MTRERRPSPEQEAIVRAALEEMPDSSSSGGAGPSNASNASEGPEGDDGSGSSGDEESEDGSESSGPVTGHAAEAVEARNAMARAGKRREANNLAMDFRSSFLSTSESSGRGGRLAQRRAALEAAEAQRDAEGDIDMSLSENDLDG